MGIWKRGRRRAGPQIESLTAAEVAWRDEQLQLARALADRYARPGDGLPPVPVLEAVVAGWYDERGGDRPHVNDVINGVGIALGQHLANANGLAWVIAIDDAGRDLAVHGQSGDVLIYPANVVATRMSAGERGFVTPLLVEMTSRIKEIRRTR